MCIGVEYFRDGEPVRVYVTQGGAQVPVRLRNGRIVTVKWGARAGVPGVEDDTGAGHIRTWPEGGWAPLDDVHAEKWHKFDPKPVKITVNRFVVVDEHQLPRWTFLKKGQYLQGLLAHARGDRRVYVVTVHTPEGLPGVAWPRIITPSIRFRQTG